MDCREVHTNLVQLISDELGAEDRAAVEQHIGSCAECGRILEESRAVAAELKQFHKGFRPSPHWRSLLLTRARLQHHVLEAATPQAGVPGGEGRVKAARASLWLAAVVLIAVVVAVPLLLLRLRGEAPPQSIERTAEIVPKPTLPVEPPPPKPAAPAVPAPAAPKQERRVPAPTRIAVKEGEQTITGTVTDIEGAPVERARIDYLAARPEREGKLRVVHKTVTDRLGRYRIVRDESETTRRWTGLLAVVADGYAASMAYVPHRLVDNDNVFVNFKLSPGKTITGRVLDRFGDPVFGARVAPGFAHVTRDANILVALSDSDGNFHVDNVPADEPITLFCEAPGNAPTLVDTPEGGGEVAVTLGEPAKIRGRVTAPGAKATVRIEFAKTELTPQNIAGWLEKETETGPDGYFEFDDLPAGTYQLSAAVDGYPLATARADLTGTREAYAQLDPVRNDLGIIRGTVRNAEGNPVKATAYAEGMTVETDDAGRFEMRLTVGEHEVGAYSGPVLVSGLQRVTVDRTGPGQEIELTLHRRPAVEATVVDADGRPVVETTVTAVSRSSPHFDDPTIEAGVISLDGLVTVSDLDPEERTEITFEDFATGNSETITLTLDWDERREVTVQLGEAYVEVEGVVVDAGGVPVIGASVLASQMPDLGHLSSVETDENGGFVLRELKPSETYQLQVSAEGFAMAQPGFEFVPQDVTSLRVVMEPATASITGVVLASDATPVPGVTVYAVSGAAGTGEGVPDKVFAFSGSDGSFEIASIAPGPYTVVARGFPDLYSEPATVRAPAANVIITVFGLVEPVEIEAILDELDEQCGENLHAVLAGLFSYADSMNGRFPPINAEPYNFAVSWPDVQGYIRDINLLICPKRYAGAEQPPADRVTDENYFYLGWTVTNEAEGLALLEAYERLDTDARDSDVDTSPGSGNSGGNTIHRLQLGIEQSLIADIDDPGASDRAAASVPVIWGRPENHDNAGAFVGYLDGRTEWVSYPGPFPMTQRFITRLEALSSLKR